MSDNGFHLDDPEADEDFQRWLQWGSMTRNWTQQDAKDFLDGFVDGLRSSFPDLDPKPRKPWWKRIFSR
jgi:hypothetical protein